MNGIVYIRAILGIRDYYSVYIRKENKRQLFKKCATLAEARQVKKRLLGVQ